MKKNIRPILAKVYTHPPSFKWALSKVKVTGSSSSSNFKQFLISPRPLGRTPPNLVGVHNDPGSQHIGSVAKGQGHRRSDFCISHAIRQGLFLVEPRIAKEGLTWAKVKVMQPTVGLNCWLQIAEPIQDSWAKQLGSTVCMLIRVKRVIFHSRTSKNNTNLPFFLNQYQKA